MEERSEFRPQTFASASSLSISGEEGFPSLGFSPVVVGRVREMLGSRGVSVNEIGPACFAPSHPLHVMPSRITRNSHRPRASDRTMVASEATNLACRSLKLDSIVTRAEKLTRMDNKPNLSRDVRLQWAGSRERNLALRSRQNFFLDIPFYRTH